MKYIFIFLAIFFSLSTTGQEVISLRELYAWGNTNYPLAQDAKLIHKIESLNLEAITRKRLPQLSLNAQAQYQSENIELQTGQISLEAPQDTYNAYVDINFNLYDGGLTRVRKQLQRNQSSVQYNQYKVQLRTVKKRINQLVFTITLSRKHVKIIQNTIDQLQENIDLAEAQVNNGTLLESELNKLKVRSLEAKKERTAIRANTKNYINLLEQLTGKSYEIHTQFDLPAELTISVSDSINRPENLLYDSQKKLLETQKNLLEAELMPKISLYGRGGIGNPNPLNFADFETSTYALGGIRLQWSFFDWGSNRKEKAKLEVDQQQIEVDRNLFNFELENDRLILQNELDKLVTQIKNSEQIVRLQNKILEQSKAQLDNDVITTSEYITQLNTSLNAQLQLELTNTQLLKARVGYLTLLGKL
ncbi:TolC family protein [Aquimarina sp. U1-2]|uniref:TolC family protein n=1 Tax=Aquimarina sp. U1-2 TaxID=2823141 RepID=UPI001AECFC81|nr:TolC family protein [Aquimarina sp. U1-2]MBP2831022.1 TolC family protein [Aquimarina sp. U1-2]